jgi:hypothetical protein
VPPHGAQCVLDVDRDRAGGHERQPLIVGRKDLDLEPIARVATIPLATVGGGVIAGVYYLAVSHLLVNGSADQAVRGAARAANA